jgi:hypothetical protein
MFAAALAIAGASDTGKNKEADTAKEPKQKESATASKSTEKTKKNPLAGCTLCHVDVEDEYVESVHFDEQVACTDCHGPSKEHLADENNEVKPEELFARKDTDRLCSECHECSRTIPTGWSDLPREKRQVCTECHGAHEFSERVVKKPTKSPAGRVIRPSR